MMPKFIHKNGRRRFRLGLTILILVGLLGGLSVSSPGLAQAGWWNTIRVSSEDAPACPGDPGASCILVKYNADLTHTASYFFDCHGDSVDLPFIEIFLAAIGVDIGPYLPWIIPGVPTPLCTLFAQGSTYKITEVSPSGTYTTIREGTYLGSHIIGTFTAKAFHRYEISLNAHGRDFREFLRDYDLTFDSFVEVTFWELDPNDEICQNAISVIDLDDTDYFDYTGNLEFSGDHDWQKINSPVYGTMVLTLDVPPDRDYQFELRSGDCMMSWGIKQHGTGVDEQFVIPVEPKEYRVHVFGKTPADYGIWYYVSALFDLNDNQWEDAAQFDLPFKGYLEYSGDEDWQRIVIPAAGATLILDVPEDKDYNLELWRDDAQVQLAASTNAAGQDEFIPVALPGTYRIHIYGVNPAVDFSVNARYMVSAIVDNIPPATTISLSGIVGNNGWYRSSVQVALSATDNPGGSGVQKTEYGFNYTPWEPFTGPWYPYSTPFTLSAEGHTYLEYRSMDNAGNVEPNQQEVIRIDTVAPEIYGVVSPPPNSNGWNNTTVSVGFSASDFQSGIYSLTPLETLLINEGAGQSVTGIAIDNAGNSSSLTMGNINIDKTAPQISLISPQAATYLHSDSLIIAWQVVDTLSGVQTAAAMLDNQPVVNGQVIEPFALSLGAHTLTIQALDRADNAASQSVTFRVSANINSLLAATSYAYERGWIQKEGVYKSLLATLQAAQASIRNHRYTAARLQLLAYIHKLNAYRGKAVNLQAYDLLVSDAIYVLDHLKNQH